MDSGFEDEWTLGRLLRERFSVRAFTSQPVPLEVVREIASLAQLTPSWCNSQPWSVTIVTGRALTRLASVLVEDVLSGKTDHPDIPFPTDYEGEYLDRRRESGHLLYEAVGIDREDVVGRFSQMLENFRFFGAPCLAIVHSPESLGDYGAIDCGGYISNFMLAARSKGVASVAQAALASRPKVLHEELDIAVDRRIVCGISFGYADYSHPINNFRTGRASVDDTVTWLQD
nr:nitroreductase [Corynebacterium sp. CNJ-954]